MPPQSQDPLGSLLLLIVWGHRCAQFRVDSPTVNIRRTISSFSSEDRNMIKTCIANNVYFPAKQNLSYEDLLIKDNELPPYLPKGILNTRLYLYQTAITE